MENVSTNSSHSSLKMMSNAKQRRSVSLLNLDSSKRNINDSLFDSLMKDPDKRKIILKMLSQEGDNIKKYKEKSAKEELARHRQIKKTQKLLHCESPTALQRRRALMKANMDSDSSSSVSSTTTKISNDSTVPFDQLLRGVYVYVDIQNRGEDRSAGAKALMKSMGATILNSLTKAATHVLFKDGSFNTYQQAKLMKVHLVSILWLEAIRNHRVRLPEKNFPALGTESYDINLTQICQEYEEAVREEYNCSRTAMSYKNRRKTALPSDLRSQTAFFNLNDISSLAEEISGIGRVSEKFVPSSQAWEAESIISHASSKLGYSNEQDKDGNVLLDSPQLSSDNSECGIINGESMTQEKSMLYNLDLTIDNLNVNRDKPTDLIKESKLLRTSIESHHSASLLSNTKSTSCNSMSILDTTPVKTPVKDILKDCSTTTFRNPVTISTTSSKKLKEEMRRTTLGIINDSINEQNLRSDENSSINLEININSSAKRKSLNCSKSTKKSKCVSKSNSNAQEPDLELKSIEKPIEHTNIEVAFPSNTNLYSTSREDLVSMKTVDFSNKKECRKTRSSLRFKENAEPATVLDSSITERIERKTRSSIMPSLESFKSSSTHLEVNVNSSVKRNASNSSKNKEKSNSNAKEPDLDLIKSTEKPIEAANIVVVSTNKTNLYSTSKEDLVSIEATDFSNDNIGRRTRNSFFKENAQPTKIVDSFITERVRRSTRKSLESSYKTQSCEDLPSLRISATSNEQSTGVSEVPSLRISLSLSEKHIQVSEDENLTEQPKVPLQKQDSSFIKSKEKQPLNTNLSDTTNNNRTGIQRKPKTFRKLFNVNDPIDSYKEDVPENQPFDKNENNATVPLIHLQPLIFTQTVIDVLNKRNIETNEIKSNKKKKLPSKAVIKTSTEKIERKNVKTPIKSLKTPKKNTKTPSKTVKSSKTIQNKLPKIQSATIDDSSKDEVLITPQLSRRSTLEFVPETKVSKSSNKFSQRNKKADSSIVCTRMHRAEVQDFMQIVKKLKGFTIEDEVSSKTSHLIVGDSKRTINLLKAITQGCWIVTKEWLFKSLEAGKWLNEEDYELTSFSVAVQQCRRQRQAFGSLFSMDVFASCGPIYVTRNSVPRCSDLEELILSCNGSLADTARSAKVVVGIWVRYENVKCVNELWVLDCITYNKQKSFKHYLLKQ